MEQYISKSALVAEIEKRLHANGAFDEVGDEAWSEDVGMCNAYKSILSFLNTLEVKEVDLEKETDKWYNTKASKEFENVFYGDIEECAKYFFELGLKAQKG